MHGQAQRALRLRAQSRPGEVLEALPPAPPEAGEPMEDIFADFERVVMPGITHWQHPRFFAYFNANAAAPSVLAEFLVSAIAPNCLIWQTSPAGTEMETRVMDWLRQELEKKYVKICKLFGMHAQMHVHSMHRAPLLLGRL